MQTCIKHVLLGDKVEFLGVLEFVYVCCSVIKLIFVTMAFSKWGVGSHHQIHTKKL